MKGAESIYERGRVKGRECALHLRGPRFKVLSEVPDIPLRCTYIHKYFKYFH